MVETLWYWTVLLLSRGKAKASHTLALALEETKLRVEKMTWILKRARIKRIFDKVFRTVHPIISMEGQAHKGSQDLSHRDFKDHLTNKVPVCLGLRTLEVRGHKISVDKGDEVIPLWGLIVCRVLVKGFQVQCKDSKDLPMVWEDMKTKKVLKNKRVTTHYSRTSIPVMLTGEVEEGEVVLQTLATEEEVLVKGMLTLSEVVVQVSFLAVVTALMSREVLEWTLEIIISLERRRMRAWDKRVH